MASRENPPMHSDELKNLLQSYIDGCSDVRRLEGLLQTTLADTRHSLLMNERGMRNRDKPGLHAAVYNDDANMVKYMLDGFTKDQVWQVVRLEWYQGWTALYVGVCSSSTESVRYLLDHMTQPQIFELLQIAYEGDTPLHRAAHEKNLQMVAQIFSCLSSEQQLHLLKIKSRSNKSVADIFLPNERGKAKNKKQLKVMQLISTEQIKTLTDRFNKVEKELADANQILAGQERKLAQMEKELVEQAGDLHEEKLKTDELNAKRIALEWKNTNHEQRVVEQRKELADASETIARLSIQLERGNIKVTDLEKKIAEKTEQMADLEQKVAGQDEVLEHLKEAQEAGFARFETFLRQPICTSHVEDQEIPDVD